MKPTTPRTVMVILAGGVGARIGFTIPKQLIKIAGKPIVEHTLEAVCAHPDLDEVLVMMNAETIGELDYLLGDPRFMKLSRILPGGKTRNETTTLAIAALGNDDNCKVLFHDAVRPFIDERIITDCLNALDRYEAVDTAITSADTIIQVAPDSTISAIPDRAMLRRGQTPQGFRLGTIRQAYELAALDPNFYATDDCGVVFSYLPAVKIAVVEGSAENMKVTEPIDIHIADKLFQLRESSGFRPGESRTPDLTGKTVVVLGGSHGIGASIVKLATNAGALVYSFSRSATGTDVRSHKALSKALAAAHDETGRIDAVILTAGVLNVSHLSSTRRREMKSTISTNLLAPAVLAKLAQPYLAKTGGQLVLFTSSSYTRGRAGYSLYSATKAGVVNLTQALSEEWADSGARINCINPQRTDTPMRTEAFGVEPTESLLRPQTVAAVCLQVLGSSMTGQTVPVQLGASSA